MPATTPRVFKLGKAPATIDNRDLMYAKYRTEAALPPRPAQFGHEHVVAAKSWQMLGNGPDDSVAPGFQGAGDCVFAGGAHETMLWTIEGGSLATFKGANAIADYSAVTGFDLNAPPDVNGNNPTDRGTNVRDALKYRQKTGLIDAAGKRHTIGAYVKLQLGNMDQLLEALYLFGIVGIGIAFPDSAMDQFNAGEPWSVVPGPDPQDGHYIPLVANRTNLECVTWGRIQQITTDFYKKYCDEAWVLLSTEMLNGEKKSPEGFNLVQLKADIKALNP